MTTDVETWQPAFEGQRPPFEPGNVLSLKHGANSPRALDPVVEDLVGRLLADPDVEYLHAASYQPAVLHWARCEARVMLLDEHSRKPGLSAKESRAAADQLNRAEAAAARARVRLGLDPMARVQLIKQLAVTRSLGGVAAVRQAGLAAMEARGLRAPQGGAL